MSKFQNRPVTIVKEGLTFGMPAVINHWDRDVKKYQVSFSEVWVGWYRLSELSVTK